MHIYFLKGVLTIKIGVTRYPTSRIAELRRFNGDTLELLGVIPGSFGLEKHIHTLLGAHRLHGEWFLDCAEVRETIEKVTSGGPKAVGYIGPKAKKRFIPPPDNRPFHVVIGGVLKLMWGDDVLLRLSEFSEQPQELCSRWLSGEESFPRLVRMALATELLVWMSPASAHHRTDVGAAA